MANSQCIVEKMVNRERQLQSVIEEGLLILAREFVKNPQIAKNEINFRVWAIKIFLQCMEEYGDRPYFAFKAFLPRANAAYYSVISLLQGDYRPMIVVYEQEKEKAMAVSFLENAVMPEILRGNPEAVEAVGFFLRSDTYGYCDPAKTAVEKNVKKIKRNDLTVHGVCKIIDSSLAVHPDNIKILALIDPASAVNHAIDWIEKGKNIGLGLHILNITNLDEEQMKASAKALGEKKVEKFCFQVRKIYYPLIARFFKAGLIKSDTAIDRISWTLKAGITPAEMKAFNGAMKEIFEDRYEEGLQQLIAVVSNKIKGGDKGEFCEDLIDYLPSSVRASLLKASLAGSRDSKHIWETGKKLFEINDPEISDPIFRGGLTGKTSASTLSELLSRFRGSEKKGWSDKLDKLPGLRRKELTDILIKTLLKTGDPDHFHLLIWSSIRYLSAEEIKKVLEKIDWMLGNTSFDRMAKSAVIALYVADNHESLKDSIFEILRGLDELRKKLTVSACERLILGDRELTYDFRNLHGCASEFLVSIDSLESVQVIGKAYADPKTEFNESGNCLAFLVNMSLKGHPSAIEAILMAWQARNSCEPEKIIAIHRSTEGKAVKGIIEKYTPLRLTASFTKGEHELYTHIEIKTIEALKDHPLIQQAFLKALGAIKDLPFDDFGYNCALSSVSDIISPANREKAIKLLRKLSAVIMKKLDSIEHKYGRYGLREAIKGMNESILIINEQILLLSR